MDCNNLHLHRWLKESLGAYEQIKKECLALYTRFSSLAEERNVTVFGAEWHTITENS